MRVKQEIFISEAKKLQDYLVVPNNLLLSLSLSLSLSRNTGLQPLLLFLNRIRARGRPRNLNKQRAQSGSLCSLFRIPLPAHIKSK